VPPSVEAIDDRRPLTLKNLYIGLMSGTSLDGVDGVLAEFESGGRPVHVWAHVHLPFPTDFARELLALNQPGADELHRAAIAANGLSGLYAQAVEALLGKAGRSASEVRAIGAHGQTVRHRPGEFDGVGYTLQLNAPALLAELTGIDVVADFRSRDVAAGGQGAPLVPVFHRAVFGRGGETIGVLNLGGMSNLTLLGPANAILGFDCGPGNALLDHWCHLHTGTPFDRDGAWGASGSVLPALLAELLAEPFFERAPPKSTGRDQFNADWLAASLSSLPGSSNYRPEDVQATLTELTARICTTSLLKFAPAATELLVCGGGALNTGLMARLGTGLPALSVVTTDARGLPALQVEACAFAWLARAWVERECGNSPLVTGAKGPRVLGALYPAR
jgi:anhydro-N-acetylmuramic acid kinase